MGSNSSGQFKLSRFGIQHNEVLVLHSAGSCVEVQMALMSVIWWNQAALTALLPWPHSAVDWQEVCFSVCPFLDISFVMEEKLVFMFRSLSFPTFPCWRKLDTLHTIAQHVVKFPRNRNHSERNRFSDTAFLQLPLSEQRGGKWHFNLSKLLGQWMEMRSSFQELFPDFAGRLSREEFKSTFRALKSSKAQTFTPSFCSVYRLPDGFTQLRNLTHLALNDVSLGRLPPDIGR